MKYLTIITTTYNSSRYLDLYFQGILGLNQLDTLQIFLVMNVPDQHEKQIVERYSQKFPYLFRIIEVPKRETISASLNRGFALVDTPYVSMLDVDDIRVSDSYDRQIATLENNPNIDYTYGDFIIVKKQGQKQGKYIKTHEFDKYGFTRGSYVGPTHCMRRQIFNKIGYWDEQLKSGGDFDFQVRATLNLRLKKTGEGPLLYYTNERNSKSASSNVLQPIERTVIEIRYGAYDKINYCYYEDAKKYRIHEIKSGDRWVPVSRYVQNYEQFLKEREYLIPIGKRKHIIRRILNDPIKKTLKKLLQLVDNKVMEGVFF